jgi:hypothetical protein
LGIDCSGHSEFTGIKLVAVDRTSHVGVYYLAWGKSNGKVKYRMLVIVMVVMVMVIVVWKMTI